MKRRQMPRLRIAALGSIQGRRRERATSAWAERLLPESIGKNARIDATISRTPLVVVAIVSGCLYAALFAQLVNLQVANGERMRGIAEGNRVREVVDFAPRGRILDRNGVVLADNTASFQLSVTPYLLPETASERASIYEQVATLTELSESEVAEIAESEGVGHPSPILVVEHINREQALDIEYALPDLVGFSLDAVPIREYKSDAALAHILGYVGRVDETDLARDPDIYPLDFVGKLGIEASYDERLRGQNGVTQTEVDALGRPLRTLRQLPTQPGEDIYLTIDYRIQKQLKESIEKQIKAAKVGRGAGVVMHAKTGEVLASVSLPDYDNNLFATGIDDNTYQRLLGDNNRPMLNRVSSEGFPTGSIIKPITLLGALDTDTADADTVIVDRGSLTINGQTFYGYNRDGLGPVNARSAIARSSNIYFFTVAGGYGDFRGMGIDNLTKYYQMFGLGSRTGIDIPQETAGLVPTPEWKQAVSGEGWYQGDTYNLAIGQGDLLASPLQMARAYAAIVNGGNLLRPQLLLELEQEVVAQASIARGDFKVAQEGMRDTISPVGTTSPATFEEVGVRVAGKSGTAETDPGKREPHAWFAAYAPYEDPELVSVVLIEEGFAGSSYAAPAIADSFKLYFKDRD